MEWVRRLDPVAVLCLICILMSMGFLAQAAYAMRLHATDPCWGSHKNRCRRQFHPFFGSERAEGAAAVTVVALSFGLFLTWASFQIRFVLPALLRRCRAFMAGRGLCSLVAEVGGRITRIGRVLFWADETGPDAKKVQREFQKRRVERLTSMAHRNCGCFLVFLLGSLLADLGTWPGWGDSLRELHWTLVFGTGAVPMLVAGIVAVFCDMFPSRVTPLLMDVMNVFMSSVWVWKLAVTHTNDYPFHQHWLAVTHLMQIFYFGNARLSVALNSLVFAVDVANVFIRPQMPGNSTPVWVFYRDLLVFIGTSTMAWALEHYELSAARLLVQTQKADQSTALVEQVLSRACDAVPQLDAELRLSEPCADLGALLMREGGIPVGLQILDLISPEDHGLFRQSLAGPAFTPSPTPTQGGAARAREPGADEGNVGPAAFAGLCHLRMQAANDEQIKVSVFYSCVPDPDGRPSYVLGIREDREEGARPAAILDEPPGPMAGRLPALAALPEDQASVASDDRSSSAWSSVSDGEGAEDGDLTVWADAESDDWRVLTCSPDFVLLGGAGGPCRSLYEWMSREHVNDIASMVDAQSRRKCVKVVVRPPGQGEYTCKVKLGPVGAIRHGHPKQGFHPVLLVFKVMKACTQTTPSEWDTTRELMAKARKKHAGCAVKRATGAAANSGRRGPGQRLRAHPSSTVEQL